MRNFLYKTFDFFRNYSMTDTQLFILVLILFLLLMLKGTFIQIGSGTIIYQNSDKPDNKIIDAIKKQLKKFLR